MKSHAMTGGVSRRNFLAGIIGGIASSAFVSGIARAQETKTLRYGLSTFPPSISPWQNTGNAAGAIKLTTMRGLMGYDQDGKLTGGLAESYDIENDRIYTFKLRADAVWSNGKPVTANDIKFSFESILAEDSTAFLKSDLSVIDDIEAVDERTVRLTLAQPVSSILSYLASFHCPMVSAESTPDNWITCGPYKIVSQERGVRIDLERNPGFFADVTLERLAFIAYPDENLRYAALEAGDVDIVEYLPWQYFDSTQEADDLELAATEGPFMFMLFNTARENSPLADARVRRAMGFAIKREDVIAAAFAGRGKPLAALPNPQGSPFDLSDPEATWSYDPERAKALLADAGYPDGFDCTILSTSTYGMHQDTAAVVQAYLAMIGVNAKLDLPEWGTRVQRGGEGDYDIAIHGTAGYANDPDALYGLLHSGPANYLRSFGFASERIDGLLEQGRGELDFAKREAIYKKLAKAYFEEAPQVPINWRSQAYGVSSAVSGFECFPGFLVYQSTYSLADASIRDT